MQSATATVQATGNGSVRSKDDVSALVRSTLLAQHTPAAMLNAAAGAAAEALEYVLLVLSMLTQSAHCVRFSD